RSRERFPSGRPLEPLLPAPLSVRVDAAVHAVLLVPRAGGEEQRVRGLTVQAVAERNAPKTVDLDGIASGRAQRAPQCAGMGLECMKEAVSEVSHQQRHAERAEAGRRE